MISCTSHLSHVHVVLPVADRYRVYLSLTGFTDVFESMAGIISEITVAQVRQKRKSCIINLLPLLEVRVRGHCLKSEHAQ